MRDPLRRAIVSDINAWVDEHRGTAVPKSPFGAALEFAYNQRTALEQFLDDPNIPLDKQARTTADGRRRSAVVATSKKAPSPNGRCAPSPSAARTTSSSATPPAATTSPCSRPSATPASCTT